MAASAFDQATPSDQVGNLFRSLAKNTIMFFTVLWFCLPFFFIERSHFGAARSYFVVMTAGDISSMNSESSLTILSRQRCSETNVESTPRVPFSGGICDVLANREHRWLHVYWVSSFFFNFLIFFVSFNASRLLRCVAYLSCHCYVTQV